MITPNYRTAVVELRKGMRATENRYSGGRPLTDSQESSVAKKDGQCYASQFISLRSGQR